MPSTPENFANIPFEKPSFDQSLVEKNLKYFVLIGIGGSSLGTKAVYEALEPKTEIVFLEAVVPEQLKETVALLNSLEPNDYLINAISKSGKTLETTTNLEYLLENVPAAKDRLIITTVEGSPFHKNYSNAKFLPMPAWISGKFSVFSTVGLFPLACAGVNIEGLLAGAAEADKNLASESAKRMFGEMQSGKNIHNLFIFDSRLEAFGKWYEQLIAESLGKDGKGITPTTSLGTNDLHSKTQLDLGGPMDKMFTFLKIESNGSGIPNAVKNALYKAAKKTYEKKVPVTEIVLPDLSEKSLGKLMQTKMFEVAELAKLMGVNPYGQPDVEEYKKLAMELL